MWRLNIDSTNVFGRRKQDHEAKRQMRYRNMNHRNSMPERGAEGTEAIGDSILSTLGSEGVQKVTKEHKFPSSVPNSLNEAHR